MTQANEPAFPVTIDERAKAYADKLSKEGGFNDFDSLKNIENAYLAGSRDNEGQAGDDVFEESIKYSRQWGEAYETTLQEERKWDAYMASRKSFLAGYGFRHNLQPLSQLLRSKNPYDGAGDETDVDRYHVWNEACDTLAELEKQYGVKEEWISVEGKRYLLVDDMLFYNMTIDRYEDGDFEADEINSHYRVLKIPFRDFTF